MSKAKNVLVWFEDRPDTVADEAELAEELGLDVEIRSSLHDLRAVLDTPGEYIVGIIVDILLYGVLSLKVFDLPNIRTDAGTTAGWAIVKHVLLAEDSPWREIPILVLSAKHLIADVHDEYEDLIKTHDIRYIEKGSTGWKEGVGAWLRDLA